MSVYHSHQITSYLQDLERQAAQLGLLDYSKSCATSGRNGKPTRNNIGLDLSTTKDEYNDNTTVVKKDSKNLEIAKIGSKLISKSNLSAKLTITSSDSECSSSVFL